MGNLLPMRFYSTISNLKNILALPLYRLMPPDKLIASIYRRLPRRAYDTARNDEQRLPENSNSKTLFNFHNKNQINLFHNILFNLSGSLKAFLPYRYIFIRHPKNPCGFFGDCHAVIL
ncbi:MAG: hypothetical protein IJ881_02505 [Neisseriaceae bacterium]|nr:hypothetical protein [Neisseriaceae bacterium]MBR3424549.1 hypothetical protein [Neisseriaceae bacterium]